MILYAAEHGRFMEFADAVKAQPNKKHNLYVNITNKCNCSCVFCLRALKKMPENHSLWLDKEPAAADIKAAFSQIDAELVDEVVFWGFGEPTMRLDILLEALGYVRSIWPSKKIRLNTNGLSSLYYKKDTAVLFKGLLDRVSVSLNASDAGRYLEQTRTPLGIGAYRAMQDFAKECEQYVPDVTVTIVDSIGAEEIEKCRKNCAAEGLKLRVRTYEAD